MRLLLTAGAVGYGTMILYVVALIAFFYFFMIRPQRKDEKNKREMLAQMTIGDSVLTSSGMYGVVIDIQDDTVIVEFGSNKNCRIPMQKAAIVQIEKPDDAVETENK